MAASNAFLTQLSERTWKCSECPLVFLTDESRNVNDMLDQFACHAEREHGESIPARQSWSRRRLHPPKHPALRAEA